MTTSADTTPRAIGVILPSSNRVVERVTRSILQGIPDIDACFARVPYAGHPPDGYDLVPFRQAAAMLAQARPDVIVWNATRGALLGFEPDRQLCTMIEHDSGIACTTTALATVELLRERKLFRIGLLAQGDDIEGQRLKDNFARQGIEIVASRNLQIVDNFEAAGVSPHAIETHVAQLAGQTSVDAVLIWSTNLAGYRLTEHLSARLGMPVLDSTTIGMHHALSVMDRSNTRNTGSSKSTG